jgi:hypothetical protein
MTKLAAVLLMMGTLASCGGSSNDNPPQLWLALGSDELHAQLVAAQPPHY